MDAVDRGDGLQNRPTLSARPIRISSLSRRSWRANGNAERTIVPRVRVSTHEPIGLIQRNEAEPPLPVLFSTRALY